MKLLALIPAYNEEDTIAKTVGALKSLKAVAEVMVIDDLSTDKTVERASQTGATVIKHSLNYGKGASLNKAIRQIKLDDFTGVLLADGDLGSSAEEFQKLINVFEGYEYGLIIAGFGPASKKGGFGLVKGLARSAIKKHGGQIMQSPLSGQRILSIDALHKVLPFAKGFGIEVDMTVKALREGFKVKEVPTSMTHKETGRDMRGFLHRGRQFKDVLKVTLGVILRRQ